MANPMPNGFSREEYNPVRQQVRADDFINIRPCACDAENGAEKNPLVTENNVSSSSSSTDQYSQPQPFHSRKRQLAHPHVAGGSRAKLHKLVSITRWFLIVILVALPFAIPTIILRDIQSDDPDRNRKETAYDICFWLLITWISACGANALILIFPYVFRLVIWFVNPAHQKYWKAFRALRNPVTVLGCSIGSAIFFNQYVQYDEWLSVVQNATPTSWGWNDAINDILFCTTMWAVIYLIEKILILYISIHYHYRSNHNRIQYIKRMQAALTTLYEASVSLYPVDCGQFSLEDSIIRSSGIGSDRDSAPLGALAFLQKVGKTGDKFVSGARRFVDPDEQRKNFRPDSSYAMVGRALEHPRAATALAKRMWMSLVIEGKEALVIEDVAEVLGPHRREEAAECFRVLDENENGDIHLKEMVLTVVEAGRTRDSVFAGMHDMNHTINTFDWISLLLIAAVMIFYILLAYVPQIKELKDTASVAVLGLGFALGRTVHQFLGGSIFLFFKHPYDIGDRIELYNMSSTSATPAIVTRISLLYTVFSRVDNGKDLQISNDRLDMKRIENISRSSANREEIQLFVDFDTTFKDMQILRKELSAFVCQKDNSRDYQPNLELRLTAIHEMNKMQLTCAFSHKSNWSDESLRAARSSKFMCALVAILRKIPIIRPGGSGPGLGNEGKPSYTVMITDPEAAKKRDAAKQKNLEKRMDYVNEEEEGKKEDPTADTEKTDLTPEQIAEAEAEATKKKKDEEDAAAAKKAAKEAADKEAEEIAFGELASIPVEKENRFHDGLERKASGIDVGDFPILAGVSTGLRRKPAPYPGV